jgi:hypothetical protein
MVHTTLFTLFRFLAIKGGVPGQTRGRPLKGEQRRGRLTLRLPPDLINAVKRAAKRQKKSQTDYLDDAVLPLLVAEGILKERPREPSKRIK